MKYVVSIRRKNTVKITVEAENKEDAIEKASQKCRSDECTWDTCSFEYLSVKEKVKNYER